MSELGERLWPEESAQPTMELRFEEEIFHLTWENTRIQFYRTGFEQFDEELRKYDHLRYREVDEKGEPTVRWLLLSHLQTDDIDFLMSNGFPQFVDPKLDQHIMDYIAAIESRAIREAIGPDFDAQAA